MKLAPSVVASFLASSFLLLQHPVWSQPSDGAPLEQFLFDTEFKVIGTAPAEESIQQRLDAIDSKLFGSVQEGGVISRVAKIKAKLADAALPSMSKSTSEKAPKDGNESTKSPGTKLDNWPKELPKFVALVPKMETIKVEISATANSEDSNVVAATKIAPEEKTYARANELLAKRDFVHARALFDNLCEQHPANPAYFYGAGSACMQLGNYHDAWPDMVIAWHLGGAGYRPAADTVANAIKSENASFHLNDYLFDDTAALLNAGTRAWRAGLIPQAAKIFEYTIRNGGIAAPAAAYNLGAMFEYAGNFKAALSYYNWALSNRATAFAAPHSVFQAGALRAIGDAQLRLAISDVQWKVAHATKTWDGWIPDRKHGSICPACAIGRTVYERTAAASRADASDLSHMMSQQRVNQIEVTHQRMQEQRKIERRLRDERMHYH